MSLRSSQQLSYIHRKIILWTLKNRRANENIYHLNDLC
nr:MAG TPA: hypothetical protein [Caudoviricetes sp.]